MNGAMNPFSEASMTSLYADDDSVADRRREFAKFTSPGSTEAADRTGLCGRSRRCNLIAAVAVGAAVVVLALGLGLGLGLGLRGRDATDNDDGQGNGGSTTAPDFSMEDVRTSVVSSTGGKGFLEGVLSYGDATTTKIIDARADAAGYTIRFGPSDAGDASITDCAAECPVRQDGTSADNALAHVVFAATQLALATYDASKDTIIVEDYAPFEADVRVLMWPGNPDAFVAWRGRRSQDMLRGIYDGVAKFFVCPQTGGVDATEVADATLYRQVKELFNTSWYSDLLDAEMLATVDSASDALPQQSVDQQALLSRTYVPDTSNQCNEVSRAVTGSSSVRLWISSAFASWYDVVFNADSVTITVKDSQMNQFFTGIVLVCRCPSGRLHRTFFLDVAVIAFQDYHECALTSVTYGLGSATNTAGGHPLVRTYFTPVFLFGITVLENATELGEKTCAKHTGGASLLRCAFAASVAGGTEGVAPDTTGCDAYG